MGNDTPKKDHLETNHESPDIKINHQKFQHFKYLSAEDLIQITTEVESSKDIKAWDNDLKRLNGFQDKEALLVPTAHEFTPKGFCGNMGSAKIYYQNFPYLFEEEIENRISMNKHFQEQQLWYLLYSLVGSARDFNSIDRKIGDIRPYNIFINEEGQIKIANVFSWPYQKTNFQKTAFEKQLTYLSPEEMRLISKGNHQNTTNRLLSESFSIGLTLLESGLLFNVRQLYSVQHYSFDLQKLVQKLSQWQNLQILCENNTYTGYSQLLKQIVGRMCSPDQNSRLSSLTVANILRPFHNQILNLKQFDHHDIQLPGEPQTQHLPVQNRPVQAGYYSTSARQLQTNAPLLNFPQHQKINIYTQNELKTNSPSKPQNIPISVGTNIIRFGNEKTRFTTDNPPTQIYEQPFARYASLNSQPPTYQAAQFDNNAYKTEIPSQYEQQFHKYSNLYTLSNTATNTANIQTPNTASNFNSAIHPISYHAGAVTSTINFNQNGYTQSGFNQPAVSTSNYAPLEFNSQFSRPISVVQAPSQVVAPVFGVSIPKATDSSSDFLKKIDEQLQQSRRQFPT